MTETPILNELTDRLTKLKMLVDNPQPGLTSWQQMLAEQMNDMVKWWTKDD